MRGKRLLTGLTGLVLLGSVFTTAGMSVAGADDFPFLRGGTSKKAFVDITDGTTAGGRVITIELRTAGGSTVASTTYTTMASDTDEIVASRLVTNFGSASGNYKVNRGKDKAGGVEVLIFTSLKRGVAFEVVVTNASDLSIAESAGYSRGLPRAMSISPSVVDPAEGFAIITLTGLNTQWTDPPPFNVVAVEFDSDVVVSSPDILGPDRIQVTLNWDPQSVFRGGVFVRVVGNDLDDDPGQTPLDEVVHDISDELFAFQIATSAPSLRPWVFLMVIGLALGAGVYVLRRRAYA